MRILKSPKGRGILQPHCFWCQPLYPRPEPPAPRSALRPSLPHLRARPRPPPASTRTFPHALTPPHLRASSLYIPCPLLPRSQPHAARTFSSLTPLIADGLFQFLCVMFSFQNGAGVAKQRLTGNQRKYRRVAQANKMGISETELLLLRRAKMAEWQMEKHSLLSFRCPNCGAFGHSFKWCPFTKDVTKFQLDKMVRFRGPNGSWNGEPPLKLSVKEQERMDQHFRILSMPLGPTPNQVTLQNVQKGTTKQ
jgi:hypothetical protein